MTEEAQEGRASKLDYVKHNISRRPASVWTEQKEGFKSMGWLSDEYPCTNHNLCA